METIICQTALFISIHSLYPNMPVQGHGVEGRHLSKRALGALLSQKEKR